MLTPTRVLCTSWSSTLRLPRSSFPPRPSPAAQADYLRQCTHDLYQWQRSVDRVLPRTADSFTLHDGPPYANGPLHIGHALNKILKDMICRFQMVQGKRVSFVPGWDCHGLPIEIKALQAQREQAGGHVHPVRVRQAACELATQTMEHQGRGFRQWAIMADWDNAYNTMDKAFELNQLTVFKRMFDRGLIYRACKPVYWSPSSRTALAEAELEYDEAHQSMAAYVRFPLRVSEALSKGRLAGISAAINTVIWTTTPWTLPANKAIAVHNDTQYCLVQDPGRSGELTILAASRVAEYEKFLACKLNTVLSGLLGSDLAGQLQYQNPFQEALGFQPVIHADFVTDSSGTGVVHLAPGHGIDDYSVCHALNILPLAPVDDAGAFTKHAFPARPELLEGLPVSDVQKTGSTVVCRYLEELGLLCGKHMYIHKYPIDWRTKQPVITRATEQWFANVQNVKEASLQALARVDFLPASGRSRLESFVQGRSQWCISRQRAWGVPIPALYRVEEGGTLQAHMDSDTIQHIISVIQERGINAWWTDAHDDLAWKPKHLTGDYVRGRDTMDVWFDSGTSWKLLPTRLNRPVADVYIEGTDQHRGWFQSSLLTHVATQDMPAQMARAPYQTLITHGFVLDSQGRKMSKSLGNVISPSQLMSGELLPPVKQRKQKDKHATAVQNQSAVPVFDAMGLDALRLWVASSDYTHDVIVGQPVLLAVQQALHKYRVTFKWLLGVFSLPTCPPIFPSFNRVELGSHTLHDLSDRLAVYRLAQISKEVHGCFSRYEFFKGVGAINKYIANDLSAFYFETLKDRVYTGDKTDCETLQHALGLIFYELLQMLAPICPLLVQEVWHHAPQALTRASVHPARALWQPLQEPPCIVGFNFEVIGHILSDLGSTIKAAQEQLRANKTIGSSLETAVSLCLSDSSAARFFSAFEACMSTTDSLQAHSLESQLASIFVVSRFHIRIHGQTLIQTRSSTFPLANLDEMKRVWPWYQQSAVADSARPGQTGMWQDALVLVHAPGGEKCPRCWRLVSTKAGSVCTRCQDVVSAAE